MVKFNKKKTKKFFKSVGKGAAVVGKKVGTGAKVVSVKAGELARKGYKSYKEYQSPEAQEARLEAQEKKLIVQQRLAQRRARIAKLQPKGAGGFGSMPGLSGGFLGGGGNGSGGFGLKPMDMSNVLTGEPQRQSRKKGKGKEFNPFNQF